LTGLVTGKDGRFAMSETVKPTADRADSGTRQVDSAIDDDQVRSAKFVRYTGYGLRWSTWNKRSLETQLTSKLMCLFESQMFSTGWGTLKLIDSNVPHLFTASTRTDQLGNPL
jgi:hypothetical protein